MKFDLKSLLQIPFKAPEKTPDFKTYIGDPDLIEIYQRALTAKDNINVLANGPPASGKTIILDEIVDFSNKQQEKSAIYLDGAHLTTRLLDIVKERKDVLRIICIDEIEKMRRDYLEMLLVFLDTGRVVVEMQKKQYDFQVKGVKVFGACNSTSKMSEAFGDRFIVLHLPEYTYEEFELIAVKKLPHISKKLAPYIALTIWESGSKSIRDVIKIGKLAQQKDTPEDINRLLRTIHKKYGAPKE